MLSLKGKNNGFSSIYKILTNQKIYKIYNKIAFSKYFRDRQSEFKKLFKELHNLKLSVNHKVISRNIIEIDELKSDQNLSIRRLFNNNKLLKNFLKQVKKINSINKKVSSRKIINEIDNYVRNSSRHHKINNNIGKLKKYIEVYDQNKICHGDLHLENIFIKKNRFLFLDWDYFVLSSSGYDLAMFAYLENLNEKQIKTINLDDS